MIIYRIVENERKRNTLFGKGKDEYSADSQKRRKEKAQMKIVSDVPEVAQTDDDEDEEFSAYEMVDFSPVYRCCHIFSVLVSLLYVCAYIVYSIYVCTTVAVYISKCSISSIIRLTFWHIFLLEG